MGMSSVTISIDGMSCGHCVARVTRTLQAIPGVSVAEVVIGRARIDLDTDKSPTAAVVQQLDDAGYPARVV